MRVVNAVLFGLMALSLIGMWAGRHPVVDAYTAPPGTLDIRLSGVDLAVERTDVGSSPFHVPAAPDTRRRPLALLFTTPTTEPPVIAMTDGATTIRGTAMGPDGPAVGGIVRIERHTDEGVGTSDVRVRADGTWSAQRLPGGRYRVRAWVPGQLTTKGSSVFFAAAEAEIELDFALGGVDPEPILQLIGGEPIVERTTGTVGVEVTRRVIDADGRIATTPVAGALVQLDPSGEVTLEQGPAQVTGTDGVAWFRLRCERVGRPNAVGRYGSVATWLALPPCVAPPPETTITNAAGGDASAGSPPTTSNGAGPTTATTAPPTTTPATGPPAGGGTGG